MLFALVLFAETTTGLMRVDDYGAYWTAAKINLAGQNPFDPKLLSEHQRQIEPHRQDPLPPWGGPGAITICYPLTPLPFAVARTVWLIAEIALFLLVAAFVGHSYRGPPEHQKWSWLATFSFYPVLLLISLGQVSIANVIASAGFLRFHASRPFLAGLLCGLVIVKPQNMIPFEWAIILWCLHTRQWKIIAGGLSTVGLTMAMILIPNPLFVSQYREAIALRGPMEMVQPTLATGVRWLFNGEFWPALSLVPIAMLVVTVLYVVRRNNWDWHREMIWLLPLSFFATPYGWMYDVTIFLVPCLARLARSHAPLSLAVSLLVLSVPAYLMNIWRYEEYTFGWFPVAVAIWIAVSGRFGHGSTSTGSSNR